MKYGVYFATVSNRYVLLGLRVKNKYTMSDKDRGHLNLPASDSVGDHTFTRDPILGSSASNKAMVLYPQPGFGTTRRRRHVF